MKRDDAPDNDRQAILARRAIFVTSAVAALAQACSSQGGEGAGTGTVVGETTTTSASGTTTATTTSTAAPVASADRKAKWKALVADMPPLDVPASLTGTEKTELDGLAKGYRELYAELERAYTTTPSDCAPKKASCEQLWKDAAKTIGSLRERLQPPHCGYDEGAAFIQRITAHAAFLRQLSEKVEAELTDAALALGDATTFPKLVQGATPAQPCLKCAPPVARALLAERWGAGPIVIAFDEGKGTLDEKAQGPWLKRLKELLEAQPERSFSVRGHADPTEPGDKTKLAKDRAQAVYDWLVKSGIPKARLTVVGYADTLPIGPPTTKPGNVANRRVDLEAR